MDMVERSVVLMNALGMLARDRKSQHLYPWEREALRARLRACHAMGSPLVLSAQERQRYRAPLLAYLQEHRPRMVNVVMAQMQEPLAEDCQRCGHPQEDHAAGVCLHTLECLCREFILG